MELMSKLLPLLLLVVLALGTYFYLPAKRFIAYKLDLSGDLTTSCCSEEEILSQNGEFDESATAAIFENKPIDYPKTSLAQGNIIAPGQTAVLGTMASNGVEKWIEVSLSEQKVRAWEGNQKVMEFPISSGLWSSTPKGTFEIWYKTRSQTMKGGSKELGTYYYLPNVPYNMFFHKGYALHGAYWHNNFGNPMSHGCVNEPIANAAQIFEWAGPTLPTGQNAVRSSPENPGTRVLVH